MPEGLSMAVTQAGHLRTTPAMLAAFGGCDRFFAARFHKSHGSDMSDILRVASNRIIEKICLQ